MFDSYARSLLIDVPELEGLTGDAAAQALSRAYLSILQYRTNGAIAAGTAAENQSYLRRLVNSLMFQVILDETKPTSERKAAAFVAAEAIALIADFIALSADHSEDEDRTKVFLTERFVRIESALLYLYAEYDACAAGVLTLPSPISEADNRVDVRAAAWCLTALESLCRLQLVPKSLQRAPVAFEVADNLAPRPLEQDTVGRLYAELAVAAVEFSRWLGGDPTGKTESVRRLDTLLAALQPVADVDKPFRTGQHFARIYHLATLLRLSFPAIGERALCHVVPAPPGADVAIYAQYLKGRAAGTEKAPGRPLLWPSAARYVHDCVLGDVHHAVVSMPTGSGKSFVAELAVSQSIHTGWALYLAPTNALAEQIRGDLRVGLKSLGTQVFAFIGDQEYSTFTTETVAQMNVNSVAVMTPEKCALGLRLAPAAFQNCSLVVFDECHLIGDAGSTRGATAELVISQLMLRAPNCRFLLMSAIIQNPDDLAGWLTSASGGNASSVSIRWRPTRTLRSVLGLEYKSFSDSAKAAKAKLESLPDNRKRVPFTAECALAACLQGAWQSKSEPDYGVVPIDCDADLSVKREKKAGNWRYELNPDSWVNGTAINLATVLVIKGIQTLVFTPANKHYPFSNGNKVALAPQALERRPAPPALLASCRILAEFELGTESVVFTLLDRGIAVHTSVMLEVEKIASEASFKMRFAPLMFATGTLAQGLNLPAIAVIIAGTRIGDSRGEDANVVKARKFSQLLNAAGRAGRAGFANQGVVITIPDKPVAFRTFDDVLAVRRETDFLQQADDAVNVESGLSEFLDNVCNNVIRSDQASEVELQTVALLTGGDADQLDPTSVLSHTYAAYLRRQRTLPAVTAGNVQHLVAMRDKFIADSGAPEWLAVAAQRAGLDFILTLAIVSAWARFRPQIPDDYHSWDVMKWLDEFLGLAPYIPAGLLERHLPPEDVARVSNEFKELVAQRRDLFFERSIKCTPPDVWVTAWDTIKPPLSAWMRGEPIADIASILTATPVEDIPCDRTAGKPIPRTLTVTGDTWSSLSLIAGGFLAIAEQLFEGRVPIALACLPMCIKYGCDSPGTLAWFRFGVRLRRASRLLATAFPVPPNVNTDEDLRDWVRKARAQWLKTDVHPSLSAPDNYLNVLNALQEFITGS